MAILDFQKPDKVIMLESNNTLGKFEFRPLEPGYGVTVGNALRRVLLSSLEGYAICSIKIEGIQHEFATVHGIKQDVTEIILNLKQVRFIIEVEDSEYEKVTINISNKKEFKAGDINNYLVNFRVLNESHVICNLDDKASLKIELIINKGRGYVPASEHEPSNDIHIINIDSIYTPIVNVQYSIENFRVEQKTDFEKLLINIETDGSIIPKDALKEAAKILIYHLMLFSDERIIIETTNIEENTEFDEESLHLRQLLKTKLIDLDLSVRALNCLKSASLETLGELVRFQKSDLLKFRNFGKKSLTELEELLETYKLDFGMDLSKYKID